MKIQIQSFHIIGLAVRTSNEGGRAEKDIPALWSQFFGDGVLAKIPNRHDDTLYCIYTDYEKDHTLPYTTILGCRVDNLEEIPEGMTGLTIEDGQYQQYPLKGNLNDALVYNKWKEIWQSPLERLFSADFEVYDHRSTDPSNAEVDIFISLR